MKSMAHYMIGLLLASPVLILVACQPKAAAFTPLPTVTSTVESISTETPIPTAVPGFRPLWNYQTDRAIWGPPAVEDGIVYIGSDDGNLYAVDAQSGSLRWKFSTQGIIRSRPAVAAGLVYISSDDGNLYAVDAQSGVITWRTDIGNFLARDSREKLGNNTAPTGWDDFQSSPAVANDLVFVGSLDGKVYALDVRTGSVEWTYQTGEKVRATPTVKDGVVYIGSWDGKTYALDARTGALVWAAPVGGQVQTTALVIDDAVYTASRKASVMALNASTGEKIFEFDYNRNMWVESSAVMQEGIVYIGSAGNKWVIGLDGQTGELTTGFFGETYFMSTPIIVDEMLVIGGVTVQREAEGGLFIFKLVDGRIADPEQPHWYFPVEDSLEAQGIWNGVISSPIVNDGVVYFGGLDGKLYAVDMNP